MKKISLSLVTIALFSANITFAFDLGSVASSVSSVTQSAPKTKEVSSNALVSELSSELGISDKQAAGGMGSILNYAKNQLPANDFSTLSQAVPDASSLMAMAPKTAALGGSSLGGMAGLASQFSSLGLSSDMITKFVPIIMDYFKSSGSTDAVSVFSKLF